MEKPIFQLSSCNAWKEWSSMRKLVTTISFSKILQYLRAGIENGDFWCGGFCDDEEAGLSFFDDFVKRKVNVARPTYESIQTLNSVLDYAYIGEIELDEEVVL